MAVNPTKIKAQAIDLATTVSSDSDSSLTTDSSGLLKSATTSTVASGGTTPITNGGVYTALGGRTAIATDATPTSGSSNLMTSGGIYTALQNAGGGGGGGTKVYYGTCTTAAGTAAKVVTVSEDQNFSLEEGVVVYILFSYTCSVGSPTLNVNNTGDILFLGRGVSYAGLTTNLWHEATVIPVVYNGEYWLIADNHVPASTSYYGPTKLNSSTSSTSTAEAATPSAVRAAYNIHNTSFTSATVSSSTKSQSIAATSSCRFLFTQTASSCTYTFTPASAGYVWYVIITKTAGYTVAFNSNITMDQTVDSSWTRVDLVFIAQTTSNIRGFVIGAS